MLITIDKIEEVFNRVSASLKDHYDTPITQSALDNAVKALEALDVAIERSKAYDEIHAAEQKISHAKELLKILEKE